MPEVGYGKGAKHQVFSERNKKTKYYGKIFMEKGAMPNSGIPILHNS